MVRKQQNRLVKNHGTITKRRQYNCDIAGKAKMKDSCKESVSKNLLMPFRFYQENKGKNQKRKTVFRPPTFMSLN